MEQHRGESRGMSRSRLFLAKVDHHLPRARRPGVEEGRGQQSVFLAVIFFFFVDRKDRKRNFEIAPSNSGTRRRCLPARLQTSQKVGARIYTTIRSTTFRVLGYVDYDVGLSRVHPRSGFGERINGPGGLLPENGKTKVKRKVRIPSEICELCILTSRPRPWKEV